MERCHVSLLFGKSAVASTAVLLPTARTMLLPKNTVGDALKVVFVDSGTYIIRLIYLSKNGMHIFFRTNEKSAHIFMGQKEYKYYFNVLYNQYFYEADIKLAHIQIWLFLCNYHTNKRKKMTNNCLVADKETET